MKNMDFSWIMIKSQKNFIYKDIIDTIIKFKLIYGLQILIFAILLYTLLKRNHHIASLREYCQISNFSVKKFTLLSKIIILDIIYQIFLKHHIGKKIRVIYN